jgi:tetratricopeptide (TPR) repeat protein
MAGGAAEAPQAGPELARAQAAVDRNPDDIEARLELTRQQLVRQDMMAVFKETQAILERSPGEPHALAYQALVRLAMGQADKAEGMLLEALKKDPQLLDGYIHLMLVYVKAGRTADAEKTLAAAAKRFPSRAGQLKELLEEMRRTAAEPQAADAAPPGADPHAGVPVAPRADTPLRAAGAQAEKRVAGSLELDPSVAGRSFPGAIVFVTLREGGFGAGPPIAAKRMPVAAFPMAFDIGASDSMTGQELPDDLLIEARVDTDGDPLTRPPTDPYGRADHVKLGTRDVRIVLKPRSGS